MSDASETQLYFNTMPSTPPSSAPATPTRGAGAAFYASYMSDLHHRRVRKGRTGPSGDAAGLVYGTKYHGRATPLKGKGGVQMDNKEAEWISSRALVPGQSFTSVRNLLTHPLSDEGTVRSAPSSPGFRSCMKMTEQSFRTNLTGSALEIVLEEPQIKKSKAGGTFAPTFKTARVFCDGGEEEIQHVSAEELATTKWLHQKAEAQAKIELEESKRPQTAPGQETLSEARKYYHADFIGHQDVLRYRHSEGICPPEYKFSQARQTAPVLSLKPQGNAKDVFFDARSNYSLNRVKGLTSSIIY